MDEEARRSSQSRLASRFALLVGALAVAWVVSSLLEARLLSPGDEAPAWSLPLADGSGKSLSLSDLEGSVVVLDFWGTSCPPCLKEIDVLAVLWRRMKPRGVAVVGVAVDSGSVDDVARFARDRDVDYPMVVDEDESVLEAYRVSALPVIYVIDRDGRIAASHSGLTDLEDLSASVKAALSTGEGPGGVSSR